MEHNQVLNKSRDDQPAPVIGRLDVPTVAVKCGTPAYAPTIPTAKPLELALADVLAEVMHVEQVSLDSHFFDDLGADSLVMAHFCARVRKRDDLPSVSMKDIYKHPTIRALAAAAAPLTTAAQASAEPDAHTPDQSPSRSGVQPIAQTPRSEVSGDPIEPVSNAQHWWCGALQLLIFLGYSYLAGVVLLAGYEWIAAGTGLLDSYWRTVTFGGATLLGTCILPIVAKWVLIGRWKQQQIRIWSLAYVRFWTIKTLVRLNPLVLFFSGTPLHVFYLRALGAKIGSGVVILTRQIPVCTDLLTIGDGAVIRKDVALLCYRARAGRIETGPVTIGKNALVSEATVLDIDTTLGDNAQLGHRSSLHPGQSVPDGERWHGSPGQPTQVDFRAVHPVKCSATRKATYTIAQLLTVVMVNVPLGIGGLALLLLAFPSLTAILDIAPEAANSAVLLAEVLAATLIVFFGGVVVSIIFMYTVPRVLNLFIKPDKVYPLYGFHYSIQRTIARITNSKLLTALFGDSSFIVPYLRGLGYDLSDVQQTGSNFGTGVKHETPYLVSIGRGTMIADGLSMMNAEFSSTSFKVTRTSIGPRNFLGNSIHYPSQGRTGDNCLLATKVMVPVDGKIREGVGLLGSPSFEIPRSVLRDSSFDHLKTAEELRHHLIRKNRYNLRTMGVFLGTRWLHLFGAALIGMSAGSLTDNIGALAIGLASVLILIFSIGYGILAERAVLRFRRLTPKFCSIYDPYFWRHERMWKLLARADMLNGTPFKAWVWRLCGVQIGTKVFDDGCAIPERTLVTIGDNCTLNLGSEIQSHSQEDGAFKSDYIRIGAESTIGIGSLVHYGVTVGEGSVIDADSFVMKGEDIPSHSRWGGNPAGELVDGRASDLREVEVGGNAGHRRATGPRAITTDATLQPVTDRIGASVRSRRVKRRKESPAGEGHQLSADDDSDVLSRQYDDRALVPVRTERHAAR